MHQLEIKVLDIVDARCNHEVCQMPISEDNVQPSQYWKSDTV